MFTSFREYDPGSSRFRLVNVVDRLCKLIVSSLPLELCQYQLDPRLRVYEEIVILCGTHRLFTGLINVWAIIFSRFSNEIGFWKDTMTANSIVEIFHMLPDFNEGKKCNPQMIQSIFVSWVYRFPENTLCFWIFKNSLTFVCIDWLRSPWLLGL